jgi:hypothetical protein
MTLPDRVSRMLPRIGRLKRQHNMIFRHSSPNQFIRDASFRPIVMNPNLLMPNLCMDDRVMETPIALPAFTRFSSRLFFELFNHRRRANLQHTGRIPDATAIHCHIRNLLPHCR